MAPKVTCHLDWLRYTIPWNETLTEIENIYSATPMLDLFQITGETVDIGQGYNHGLRMRAGIVLWNDERHSQGISVQLAGLDLQELRQTTLSELGLLQWISAQGGHVSTMHSCLNVHDASADVQALINAHSSGKISTRARQVGVYSSKTKVTGKWQQGDTFYIGSARSAIQVRVYNKAAEQQIAADWTRIEIVWRKKHARAAAEKMLTAGIEATTRGAIRHQLDTDLDWWRLAMTGETEKPEMMKRKKSKRYLWLRHVVLPVLEKEIAEENRTGEGDIKRLFAAVVNKPDRGLHRLTDSH